MGVYEHRETFQFESLEERTSCLRIGLECLPIKLHTHMNLDNFYYQMLFTSLQGPGLLLIASLLKDSDDANLRLVPLEGFGREAALLLPGRPSRANEQ